MDALDDAARVERLRGFCEARGLKMFEISAVAGYGLNEFVNGVGAEIEKVRRSSEVVAAGS